MKVSSAHLSYGAVLKALEVPVVRVALRSIVLALFMALAVLFLRNQVDERAGRIGELRKEQRSRLTALEYTSTLRSDFQKARDIIPRMKTLLPGDEAGVGFLNAVSDLALRHELKYEAAFQSASPVPSQTVSGLREIGFSLSLDGGYENIKGFLRDFRMMPYLARLERIDATSGVNLFSVQELKLTGLLYLK